MELLIKRHLEPVITDILQHKIDCKKLDKRYYELGMLYASMNANTKKEDWAPRYMNTSGIIAYPRLGATSDVFFMYEFGHTSHSSVYKFELDSYGLDFDEVKRGIEYVLCKLYRECIEIELNRINRENNDLQRNTPEYKQTYASDIDLDDLLEGRVVQGSIFSAKPSWVYSEEYKEKLRKDSIAENREWSIMELQSARQRDIASRKTREG